MPVPAPRLAYFNFDGAGGNKTMKLFVILDGRVVAEYDNFTEALDARRSIPDALLASVVFDPNRVWREAEPDLTTAKRKRKIRRRAQTVE
jgi:hypothetical protein